MLVHAGPAAGGGRYRLALLRPPPASGLCYGMVAYAVLAAFAGRAAPSPSSCLPRGLRVGAPGLSAGCWPQWPSVRVRRAWWL
eukprot:2287296-Alexandrium_andersonii.AAC.1